MKTAPNARVLSPVASAVYLHVNELRPSPRNPRAHGAEVQRLARTILRTTWGAPIIAQASTRRIIGGHGRLEAARLILAGLEVDGILRGGADHRFDRDAPEPGMVPVRLVDVSDAEADAMTLADNARALQGQDDAAAVVAMATAAFERGAPTMEDIGLGVAELDALVKAAGDAVLAGEVLEGEHRLADARGSLLVAFADGGEQLVALFARQLVDDRGGERESVELAARVGAREATGRLERADQALARLGDGVLGDLVELADAHREIGSHDLGHEVQDLRGDARRELRQHESSDPSHIFSQKAYDMDQERLGWFFEGRHDLVLDTMPEFLTVRPEGKFAHYLMMAAALGERDFAAPGRQYGDYENSIGTSQVHVWFDRPEGGWTRSGAAA